MEVGLWRRGTGAVFTVCALALAVSAWAQPARTAAVIWEDRGDIAALDLIGGPGGKGREPGVAFMFVKESHNGTAPKFEVVDEHGTTWMVKVGEEAKSETAATRLLWAAGYLVDEDYYRPQIHVSGLPRLTRGQAFVSAGGIVSGARLERRDENETSQTWSWYDNPFVGTREFNGLRVMMALVNNWDLKNINNSATDAPDGGGDYSVTDLGATFGRTGDSFSRSKSVPKDYAESRFVSGVTPTSVDFVMHSRPFFLSVFNVPNYRVRTKMESVAKDIPIADARWIGDQLGRLSAEQVGDAFRAAGFSLADVETNARVVMQRIAILQAIDPPSSAPTVVGQPDASPAVTDAKAERCLASTCRQVPTRETLSAIGVGTAYARAIVGGFEEGAGLGGGVQVTSAGAIPVVQLRAAALVSIRRYRRFDLEAYLPHIGGSRNHADVWGSYLRRDLDYFGVDASSPELEKPFTIVQRSYQGSFYRDLASQTQGGIYAQLMRTESSRDGDAGVDPTGQFPSTPDQSPAQWIAGVVSNTRILSYGGFLHYDTRDNSEGLTRGVDLYGRVASADGLGADEASAGYGWVEGEFDIRGYTPLGSPRTALLLRSRGEFATPRGGRQIPFYDLPSLGGRGNLRGYSPYRFRGNQVLVLSTELQQTIYAISGIRGVDVFGSADAGRVWRGLPASAGSPDPAGQDIDVARWHSSLGGGLQYRHSRSVAMRVEVGHSREGSITYLSMSRGF